MLVEQGDTVIVGDCPLDFTGTATLSADDLAMADRLGDVELTIEKEYAEAVDA